MIDQTPENKQTPEDPKRKQRKDQLRPLIREKMKDVSFMSYEQVIRKRFQRAKELFEQVKHNLGEPMPEILINAKSQGAISYHEMSAMLTRHNPREVYSLPISFVEELMIYAELGLCLVELEAVELVLEVIQEEKDS